MLKLAGLEKQLNAEKARLESELARVNALLNALDSNTAARPRKRKLSAKALAAIRAAQAKRWAKWVSGHVFRQKLQSDKAAEFSVLGLVDNPHPAAAKLLDDAVMRNRLADHFKRSRNLGKQC